jgi:hypothetical protein
MLRPRHGQVGSDRQCRRLTARNTEAMSGMRNTALVHLTKALPDQLGPDGITANIVHSADCAAGEVSVR